MMNNAVVVAISAMVLMGCGSSSGTPGAGGHSGGAPGSGGTTTSTGGSGGIGGSVASGGAGGGAGTAAGGIPGSGGKTDQGGNTGTGGNKASDAAASGDAAADAAQCPVCTTIRCAYGSPVDDNGCTVCVCNPAPDGAIDMTTDGACALPQGCSDTGTEAGLAAEAGGSRDITSPDAIRCGKAICRPGEYCCNPLTDTCVPPGGGCGF